MCFIKSKCLVYVYFFVIKGLLKSGSYIMDYFLFS